MVDKVVKGVYEFGPYRLDATERTLTRNRQPVELTPQRFDMLLLLLRSQGRVLGKWELIKAVWHDVSNFDENNLNYAIAELRRALQDTQKPHQYIETVARRRGTRFCAPVREIGVPPTLAVLPFVPDDQTQVGNPNFGRGMDDAIITRLNKIRSLVVRPKSATAEDASSTNRTAQGAFGKSSKSKRNAPGSLGSFTRSDRDPLALGHQLVVDYVLDCRIRQSGHRIRVHAKIINVRQGEPRWDELFDEYESDIFKLEDLISEQVIGQFDKAIEYAQKGKAVSHRNPLNLAILTLAYALSGAKTEAQDALNELLEARERRYVSPYHLSLACAALGKQTQAYKFLNEACALRDQWLLLWRIDPKFDLHRSDEKSMKLLQSTKLSSL